MQVSFFIQSLPIFAYRGSNFTTCPLVTSLDTDLPCAQWNPCLIFLFFFQGQNTYLQYQIKCLHTYFTPIPPTIFLLLLLISNYLFKISTWHFLSYNNFSLTSVHSSFIYFLQVSATRKDFSFSPNRKTNTAFTFSSAA